MGSTVSLVGSPGVSPTTSGISSGIPCLNGGGLWEALLYHRSAGSISSPGSVPLGFPGHDLGCDAKGATVPFTRAVVFFLLLFFWSVFLLSFFPSLFSPSFFSFFPSLFVPLFFFFLVFPRGHLCKQHVFPFGIPLVAYRKWSERVWFSIPRIGTFHSKNT